MFYIHIKDPGYPDPPYPGERRLGPYLTKEEAIDQAISDATVGMGVAVGIFSDEESKKREDDVSKGEPIYTSDQIYEDSKERLTKIQAQEAANLQITEDILRSQLPEGVTWTEMQEAAKGLRA